MIENRMENTFSINIKIDNRVYPLSINRENEKRYRDAAKVLNELIRSFRNDYPDHDSQDVIAMTAFQLVYTSLSEKEKANQSPLINDLKDIRDDIADFLEQKGK
jgi:cell division protein ZapA